MTRNQHKDNESCYITVFNNLPAKGTFTSSPLFFVTFFCMSKDVHCFPLTYSAMQDLCLICCFLKPCVGLDANCCGDLLIQSKPQSWSFSPHSGGIKSTMNSSKPPSGTCGMPPRMFACVSPLRNTVSHVLHARHIYLSSAPVLRGLALVWAS